MQHLRSCVERLYLEVFPADGIEDQLLRLPDGAHLGITCSPQRGLKATLDLVERLQGHDFRLVPHVAARQVRDRQHLADLVQQLDESEVRAVFFPAGHVPVPVGRYTAALDLLRDLEEIGHRFEHVGVTAYPEGHPAIDEHTLHQTLLDKQRYATYMVTQMCFDPEQIRRWLGEMRALGVSLPCWIGIPGVMDRMQLFKTSLRIGVGESLRFARKQTNLAGRLLRSSSYRPDELVTALSDTIEDMKFGVGGFYLFSFNQVGATVQWREDMLRQLNLEIKAQEDPLKQEKS